ncbi:MAG: hypothetical protein OXF93_16930 [Acidobacteria bacterium]|nr:hypothetical protein [Acidobacteriota bacterium]
MSNVAEGRALVNKLEFALEAWAHLLRQALEPPRTGSRSLSTAQILCGKLQRATHSPVRDVFDVVVAGKLDPPRPGNCRERQNGARREGDRRRLACIRPRLHAQRTALLDTASYEGE